MTGENMTAEIGTKVFGEDKFTVEDVKALLTTLNDKECMIVNDGSSLYRFRKPEDGSHMMIHGNVIVYFDSLLPLTEMSMALALEKDKREIIAYVGFSDLSQISIQDVEL